MYSRPLSSLAASALLITSLASCTLGSIFAARTLNTKLPGSPGTVFSLKDPIELTETEMLMRYGMAHSGGPYQAYELRCETESPEAPDEEPVEIAIVRHVGANSATPYTLLTLPAGNWFYFQDLDFLEQWNMFAPHEQQVAIRGEAPRHVDTLMKQADTPQEMREAARFFCDLAFAARQLRHTLYYAGR